MRNSIRALAKRVAAGLGFVKMPAAPAAAAPVQEMEPSPALQIIGKMKDTLMGRAIGILIADVLASVRQRTYRRWLSA